MGKAFEMDLVCLTLKNASTTTIKQFRAVRLDVTTAFNCYMITTKGTVPAIGVTQVAIPSLKEGQVAISGISRIKMAGTGITTLYVTTPAMVTANASGCAKHITTTTYWAIGTLLHTAAASDIASVMLRLPAGTAR